jgi:hypothetical protein
MEEEAEDSAPATSAAAGVVDDDDEGWEQALDLAEMQRIEKEKEEKRAREENERVEAEIQRKKDRLEAREAAKVAKSRLATFDDDDDDPDAKFMDVDKANKDRDLADYNVAVDLMGGLDGSGNSKAIDIGTFICQVATDFPSYAAAVVDRIGHFDFLKSPAGSKFMVSFVQFMVNALTDDYKASELRDLEKWMLDKMNDKIKEDKKKHGASTRKKRVAGPEGKTFFNDEGGKGGGANAADDFDFM